MHIKKLEKINKLNFITRHNNHKTTTYLIKFHVHFMFVLQFNSLDIENVFLEVYVSSCYKLIAL